MKLPSWKRALPAVLVAGLIGGAVAVKESTGSDHQQTPLTELNPRLDITDVWVFPGSSDDRVVLAMTIASPLIGTQNARFDPNALYQIKVDRDTNGLEDLVFQFSFDEMMDGTQVVDVIGPVLPQISNNRSVTAFPQVQPGGIRDQFSRAAPAVRRGALNTTLTAQLAATEGAQAGSMQVFAGVVDDPFYIDLEQFFRIVPDRRPSAGPLSGIGGVTPPPPGTIAGAFRPRCGTNNQPMAGQEAFAAQFGCATDFLRGLNALVIAVELPESQLVRGAGGADPQLGIWATVSR